MDLDWQTAKLRIINVYADVDRAARKDLLSNLGFLFLTNRSVRTAGDFNIFLDKDQNVLALKNFISDYHLKDGYRELHKGDPGFTWGNSRGARSRIDYIFLPREIPVTSGEIIPAFYTDHNLLKLTVEIKNTEYGKVSGLWGRRNQSQDQFREVRRF